MGATGWKARATVPLAAATVNRSRPVAWQRGGFANVPAMARCMICAKERSDQEVRGGICRACAESVRREAAGAKLREKRAAERAIRASGREPEPDTRAR